MTLLCVGLILPTRVFALMPAPNPVEAVALTFNFTIAADVTPANSDTTIPGRPAIATDGTNYLVVSCREFATPPGIFGALVSATGTVLETFPIAATNPVFDCQSANVAVAFDGTTYLVVFVRDGQILGVRVSTAGVPMDAAAGFAISSGIPYVITNYSPSVTFDGSRYLVVWNKYIDSSYDIYGARVSTSAVVSPEFLVAGNPRTQVSPAVASDGVSSLVVWNDNGDIVGARVSQAGAVLDPGEIPISSAAGSQDSPHVVYHGGQYFVVWQDSRNDPEAFPPRLDIFGARITADGTLLDGPPNSGGIAISTVAVPKENARVAFDGSNYFVIWDAAFFYDPPGGIYSARVSADGVLIDGPPDVERVPVSQPSCFTCRLVFPEVVSKQDLLLAAWINNTELMGEAKDVVGALIGPSAPSDADGDGFPAGVDCNDADPAIHPGAVDVCNGIDDDCDGVIDGAVEVCNGTDDDCDGVVDDGGDALCDDGNECSDDVCDPVGGCRHANNTSPCDDGNLCTTSDVCGGGFCGAEYGQRAISASTNTCALRSDGRLACWGADWYGEVSGPNGSADSYAGVSAGSTHTCALGANGRLACWGADWSGEVSGPNGSTDTYTEVSAGSGHTCALRTNGRLACWGRDAYGEVSGPNESTASYTAVGVGASHTCALRSDGRLACWGWDFLRQVSGPNESTDSYAAVSAGFYHTCALRSDGRLACWGDNNYGQRSGPNGSTDSYTAVSVGVNHTCGLRTNGRLDCWGFDRDGDVSGPNESTDSYTAVDAGDEHTCALRSDGRLACWGADDFGEISGPNSSMRFYGLGQTECNDGNMCTADSCDPIQGCVYSPGNSTLECRPSAGACDVAEYCNGADAACPADAVLAAATICRPTAGACDIAELCDGVGVDCPANDLLLPASTVCRPATGQCGDDAETCTGTDPLCPPNQQNVPNGTPCDDGNVCTTTTDTCVSGFCNSPSEQAIVSAGDQHTCALGTDGRLACWGYDSYGEVSGPNGSTDNYSAVSTGGFSTCSLRTDGRLKCWGYDEYGQVSGPNSPISGYTAVSANGFSTCALRLDGRLACWGADWFGEFGGSVSGPNGSTDSYTAVSSGVHDTCALRADKRLVCWGDDYIYGQVSGPNGSTDSYTAISAGFYHTCALRMDGRLACWANDEDGQVSGPNQSTDSYTAVSAGFYHTCALRSDGRLACWGRDDGGQVSGPNGSTDSYRAVSAGGWHTCALRSDGRLACWGYEGLGEVSGPNASTRFYGRHQLDCNDNSVCTDDACDEVAGCVHPTPTWAACDDGNACTTDTCHPVSGCVNIPVDAAFCDDGNVCTDDSCNPATGCVHETNVAPCDDGSACTRTDICSGGVCVGANEAVCLALDQCHGPGVCDPVTGVCSNPNKPDGAACTDDNLCTTGDACLAGVCTPSFSGLNEPNPRTNGYYKRLCHGPHTGDRLSDADATCVAQLTTTFSGISTVAQICDVIEPSTPNSDKCNQTEDDLMILALNICRARVCTAQAIDSQCGGNANVGQSLAESDAILANPSRGFSTCSHAKCLDEEINTGRALELNSLTLHREAGSVRLDWSPPYLNDGTGVPSRYNVWRRAQGSLAPFAGLGETMAPSFLDTTSGDDPFEYEVTWVMN